MNRLAKLALAAAMVTAAGGAMAQDIKGLTIGSGSVGADFFVLGTSLQRVLGETFPQARIENTATTGSVENFRLLRRKDVDIGFFANSGVADAWHGRNAFANEKPFQEMRTISGAFHFTYGVVTLKSSAMRSMADLKGKRVGIGPDARSSTPLYSPFITAHGLDYEKDFQHVYASYADIFRMTGEGRVDAVIGFTSGLKLPPALQELVTSKEVRWIPMDAERLKRANIDYITFPAGTFPHQDAQLVSARIGLVGVATTDQMADNVAYAIAKVIHQNLARIADLQPAMKQSLLEPTTLAAATDPIPYHPGAMKYWQEVGLWKR